MDEDDILLIDRINTMLASEIPEDYLSLLESDLDIEELFEIEKIEIVDELAITSIHATEKIKVLNARNYDIEIDINDLQAFIDKYDIDTVFYSITDDESLDGLLDDHTEEGDTFSLFDYFSESDSDRDCFVDYGETMKRFYEAVKDDSDRLVKLLYKTERKSPHQIQYYLLHNGLKIVAYDSFYTSISLSLAEALMKTINSYIIDPKQVKSEQLAITEHEDTLSREKWDAFEKTILEDIEFKKCRSIDKRKAYFLKIAEEIQSASQSTYDMIFTNRGGRIGITVLGKDYIEDLYHKIFTVDLQQRDRRLGGR